jgi:hypothetical protein
MIMCMDQFCFDKSSNMSWWVLLMEETGVSDENKLTNLKVISGKVWRYQSGNENQ